MQTKWWHDAVVYQIYPRSFGARDVLTVGDDGRYRIASAKMLATALHLLKGTPYVYRPLLQDHPQIFAYQRSLGAERLVVINNFSAETVALELPGELAGLSGECLICNYAPRHRLDERLVLQPYESFAVATRTAAA